MNYKHTLGLSLKDKHCKHFMGYREGITLKKYIMVAKRQGFNCVKTRGAVNYLSETSKVFYLSETSKVFILLQKIILLELITDKCIGD